MWKRAGTNGSERFVRMCNRGDARRHVARNIFFVDLPFCRRRVGGRTSRRCERFSRLRTCGERDCGAEAAASGGLRYYGVSAAAHADAHPHSPCPCSVRSRVPSLSVAGCPTDTLVERLHPRCVYFHCTTVVARIRAACAKCNANCELGCEIRRPAPLLARKINKDLLLSLTPSAEFVRSTREIVCLFLISIAAALSLGCNGESCCWLSLS